MTKRSEGESEPAQPQVPPTQQASPQPDRSLHDSLPPHAHERIADMRAHKLFTCDLSINEFLLVKEAGFDPLGLVMGTSIYQIVPQVPQIPSRQSWGNSIGTWPLAISSSTSAARWSW